MAIDRHDPLGWPGFPAPGRVIRPVAPRGLCDVAGCTRPAAVRRPIDGIEVALCEVCLAGSDLQTR